MEKTEKLVIQPTDTAQWHALVNEAQVSRCVSLAEDLESYLVFLLMRYTRKPNFISSVIAVELLESEHTQPNARYQRLKDVGDKCLLFSGLFPGIAKKRHVGSRYYVSLGQSAYGTLSSIEQDSYAYLYRSLCDQFVSIMDVLAGMRMLSKESMEPIFAYDLWQKTGSMEAEQLLDEYLTLSKGDKKIISRGHGH